MNYVEILMKDNNLKINEKFYLQCAKQNNGEWYRISDFKYHFDENLNLILHKTVKDNILFGLLIGKFKIEKISQK